MLFPARVMMCKRKVYVIARLGFLRQVLYNLRLVVDNRQSRE